MTKVHEINWADMEISRSGIIPIYDDGKQRWIGLGVNRFSGNISTIGGAYEPTDHDLLSTAVREYNEEVGKNMENVTEKALYNNYVVKSEYSVSILHPVSSRCVTFTLTDELFDILWVTPKQLRIMAINQDYILPSMTNKYPSFGARGFLFGTDLRLLAHKITIMIEFNNPFNRIKSNNVFDRPKRATAVVPSLRIVTDIDEFNKDSETVNNWGICGFVLTKIRIGIMRRDYVVYILPNTDIESILLRLDQLKLRICVATKDNFNELVPFAGHIWKRISTVEYILNQVGAPHNIRTAFYDDLSECRTKSDNDRIITEAKLIIDYENIVYQIGKDKETFFNNKRAIFLKGISIINKILSDRREGIRLDKLMSELMTQYPSDNEIYNIVLRLMVTNNLIKEDKKNSHISL